jgi:exodeoxyribonuclease VII small subunit
MAKENRAEPQLPERYDEVAGRLDEVVKRLEGGKLSLEESLKAFEEGIRLVRKGESLLSAAERRIEELLHEEGQEKEVPLEAPARAAPAKPTAKPRPPSDEDIPF